MAYWIKKAIGKDKGKLRAKAKVAGALTQRGTISKVWLNKQKSKAGVLGKEARLALTLSKLRKR